MMIFIWKRRGLLVPLAIFLDYSPILILAGVTMDLEIERGNLLLRIIGFVGLITMFLPALINYFFSKKFLKDEGIKIVTDEEVVQYKLDTYSKFFFIKNSTWTIILLIFPIVTSISYFFE